MTCLARWACPARGLGAWRSLRVLAHAHQAEEGGAGEGAGAPSGAVCRQSLPDLFELQRETAKEAGVEWKHNALRHLLISYRVGLGGRFAGLSGDGPRTTFDLAARRAPPPGGPGKAWGNCTSRMVCLGYRLSTGTGAVEKCCGAVVIFAAGGSCFRAHPGQQRAEAGLN